MQTRRGFTVVELVVVMVIMAILLALVMAGISPYQASLRDKERTADVEAIARGLEQRYAQGNPKVKSTSSGGTINYTAAGGYPSVLELLHIGGENQGANGFVPEQISGGYYDDALPGTTAATRRSPGVNSGMSLSLYCFFCSAGPEDAAYLETKVTTSTYVYEPLTASGTQCDSGKCVRFNLYYRTEVDKSLHTIRSKHQ